MTETTQRSFKTYYKPKGFSSLNRKADRYCFNCHKVKPVLSFDKPSMDFRYACKCRECFKGKLNAKRI